jgi:hypothetical protein
MKLLARLRDMIDREWIKSGYSGQQTFKHRIISLAPLVFCVGLISLIEPWSYWFAFTVMTFGFVSFLALHIWIGSRGALAMGYSSTRRSERFVRRGREARMKSRAKAPPKGISADDVP